MSDDFPNAPEMRPCPKCGGKPLLCTPNYADEGGTMVVCEVCDFAGDSFMLGEHAEGVIEAIETWNVWGPMHDLDNLKTSALRLEADMRRYVYDRTPERRIQCLDNFRKNIHLGAWNDQKGGDQ